MGWVELSDSVTFAIASLSKEKDDGDREAVKIDVQKQTRCRYIAACRWVMICRKSLKEKANIICSMRNSSSFIGLVRLYRHGT